MKDFTLPKFLKGNSAAEAWFNELRSFLRSCRIQESPECKPVLTNQGTFLRIKIPPAAQPSTPGTVQAYNLVAVNDDSYSCTDLLTGDAATIAKPLRLRRSGWDGETRTLNDGNGAPYEVSFTYHSAVKRTIQIQTYSEVQVIVPGYMPGIDIIFASASSNGTGIFGVELIDLNVEGRAWARSRLQAI